MLHGDARYMLDKFSIFLLKLTFFYFLHRSPTLDKNLLLIINKFRTTREEKRPSKP